MDSVLAGKNNLLECFGRSAEKAVFYSLVFIFHVKIHHAAFLTDQETFITVGPDHFRYSRYWQDRISEKPILNFYYKFCRQFRAIGLNQVNFNEHLRFKQADWIQQSQEIVEADFV